MDPTTVTPICPLERNHDTLHEEDCWACGLIQGLWAIATGTTDSGDPVVEAMVVLDECVGYA